MAPTQGLGMLAIGGVVVGASMGLMNRLRNRPAKQALTEEILNRQKEEQKGLSCDPSCSNFEASACDVAGLASISSSASLSSTHISSSRSTESGCRPADTSDGGCEQSDMRSFLWTHGLEYCVVERTVGAGAFGRADLVRVPCPDGSTLMAVRKTNFGRPPHTPARAVHASEVAAMQAARGCPHAVQLLGASASGNYCLILMEHCPGGTLHDELEAAYAAREACGASEGVGMVMLLPEPRLRSLAAQLLAALKWLHGRGFAHFDVKPSNILFDEDGGLRLADFGSAVARSRDGSFRPVGGSLAYAAPEVAAVLGGKAHPEGGSEAEAEGCARIDERADVVSVGAVLAAAAGFFRDGNALAEFMDGERRLPEAVPPGLRAFIAFLLPRDPAQRPTAAQALAHPFITGA
ncbi:hypothetical protein HYH03_013750 [Edaphochlamys debaryana]|uniref:non-specific serine/threonine protein kinase n=1 Tax=Edaphochlamys debaryana TaxID=47281 RepID=A0A835XSW1_9CHLO|nr:hypothetical protein HYH03_013750 [Edaphochlamys debaryana]|eukprot:KAG2487611.1 hypothetical protein HYH03_013750 [Edaphochlamys debaryana]